MKKAYVSLTEIGDALRAFNLLSSSVDQVKLLVREMEKKDRAFAPAWSSLSVVHADLENLHLENVSLSQKLDEASNTGLLALSESFENALLQVEHFYPLMHILREQISPK